MTVQYLVYSVNISWLKQEENVKNDLEWTDQGRTLNPYISHDEG